MTLRTMMHVSESEGFAVLDYNLNTFVRDSEGNEVRLRTRNATHAYLLIEDKRRIVHSNWALTQTITESIAS